MTSAVTIGTEAIFQATGNQNVADINPARAVPGGGWSPVAVDRPAQAGAFAGRHRRRASELLFLFSMHYGTPDQRGSDANSLAHQPVSLTPQRPAGGWAGHARVYPPSLGVLPAGGSAMGRRGALA